MLHKRLITTLIIIACLCLPLHLSLAKSYNVNLPYQSTNQILETTQVPVYPLRIIKRYPHRDNVFTQGIIVNQSDYYESVGLYGDSSLAKIDLETSKVIHEKFFSKNRFAEDICLWHDNIYLLSYLSKTAYIYDAMQFQEKDQLSYDHEGWGITSDGSQFIVSDGSSQIYFKEPTTFSTKKTITVHDNSLPIHHINALTYTNKHILANIWQTCLIAVIAPCCGEILAYLDSQAICQEIKTENKNAAEQNGVSWDAKNHHLYLTGKYWQTLFEVEIIH